MQSTETEPLEKQLLMLNKSVAELRVALAYGVGVHHAAIKVADNAFAIDENFYHIKDVPENMRFTGD